MPRNLTGNRFGQAGGAGGSRTRPQPQRPGEALYQGGHLAQMDLNCIVLK
jgi:hypothetical protein